MRVLHMPVNTASIAYTTVKSLREQGVDASGLMFATNVVQSFEGLRGIPMGNKRHPHKAIWGLCRFAYYLMRYLQQGKPDVIHWYYSGSASTLDMDVQLLKMMQVPGLVEWAGSDIRDPELEAADNPYYKAVFNKGYEYQRFESKTDSRQRQERFARIGFHAAAATGMRQYILPGVFQHVHALEQRLILSEFEPRYPHADNPLPLVVHSPTAPVTKGTEAVLKAIEALEGKLKFRFQLVQGVPRAQALQMMREADIFLDQFVLGDRGLASLEAMAFGKPVVCYIKPSLHAAYPADLPIVNATKDTLVDVLAGLIQSGPRRAEIGRASRAFVERHHDAKLVIPQLKNIYQRVAGYQ
jgi:hypothetical protein